MNAAALLLLLAWPSAAQTKPDIAKLSYEDKLRASLILCMRVGASPEGRQDCARVLSAAKALSRKKRPAAAPEPAVAQVEGFLASLDASSGTKTAAQLETEFEAIAKSLPVRQFKPQYAKHFPPPAPPPSAAPAKGAAEDKEAAKGKLGAEQQKALQEKAASISRALNQNKEAGSLPAAAKPIKTLPFEVKKFPGFYDAKNDMPKIVKIGGVKKEVGYNVPQIREDIPRMWTQYGPMFKKVAAEQNMDPYALAAFCVFESYNDGPVTKRNPRGRNFNPGMRDDPGGDDPMGCGIAATQTKSGAACDRYRRNPEESMRALAKEFNERMSGNDIADTIWRVAVPGWGRAPEAIRGHYGNRIEYISRAHVFYEGFRAADKAAAAP